MCVCVKLLWWKSLYLSNKNYNIVSVCFIINIINVINIINLFPSITCSGYEGVNYQYHH
ncbi:hypothetical protein DPX39_010035200 [Trypanosoma brucei equiperdum]|uniref:Uncharacterized protein n=1 Tax=Trypanosoma brucei equiperdum TaxID=630700 RepID=A0A3L6LFI2_9TRYP|nr:hypothetical protein DPX39_010035200 [Trypanosoma brucei equiperdum]